MKVVCSYCKNFLRDKPPFDDERISHGVCPACYKRFTEQLKGLPLDEYLDGFDAPVIVVRGDSRVVALNRAMESLLGRKAVDAMALLGGEALECAFARLPGGCGQTVHCETCTIRRTVEATMKTGQPTVDEPAYLTTNRGRVALRITTKRIDGVVRVTVNEAEAVRPSDAVRE